jgi:hypothetical protein
MVTYRYPWRTRKLAHGAVAFVLLRVPVTNQRDGRSTNATEFRQPGDVTGFGIVDDDQELFRHVVA